MKSVLATLAVLIGITIVTASAGDQGGQIFTIPVEPASPPDGWVDFCRRYAPECDVPPSTPHDIHLETKTWNRIVSVNKRVNSTIKQKNDVEHWGLADKWDYPDDGYGDCEDYALLKQRLLRQNGYPREALLLTVVWTKSDIGHVVLIVRTDKGDYVLDNLSSKVLLWSEVDYSFVKRQTQSDPNSWVYIDGPTAKVASNRTEGRRQCAIG